MDVQADAERTVAAGQSSLACLWTGVECVPAVLYNLPRCRGAPRQGRAGRARKTVLEGAHGDLSCPF